MNYDYKPNDKPNDKPQNDKPNHSYSYVVGISIMDINDKLKLHDNYTILEFMKELNKGTK